MSRVEQMYGPRPASAGNGGGAKKPPVVTATSSDEDPLFDSEDAAKYLTMSVRTLYNKREAGEIKHIRMGRLVRYKKSALDDYLDRCSH